MKIPQQEDAEESREASWTCVGKVVCKWNLRFENFSFFFFWISTFPTRKHETIPHSPPPDTRWPLARQSGASKGEARAPSESLRFIKGSSLQKRKKEDSDHGVSFTKTKRKKTWGDSMGSFSSYSFIFFHILSSSAPLLFKYPKSSFARPLPISFWSLWKFERLTVELWLLLSTFFIIILPLPPPPINQTSFEWLRLRFSFIRFYYTPKSSQRGEIEKRILKYRKEKRATIRAHFCSHRPV